MAQLMPLPLTVSCFTNIQIGFTFLVLAHPGSSEQRAIKRVCVCVSFLKTKQDGCEQELPVICASNVSPYEILHLHAHAYICSWHRTPFWFTFCSIFLLLLLLLQLLHPFNGLFSRTTWISRYQTGKTSLDLNEARHDGVLGCSGISWTICKQSAPRSRQLTTPTPHHSIFTGRMLFLTTNQQCQSTVCLE